MNNIRVTVISPVTSAAMIVSRENVVSGSVSHPPTVNIIYALTHHWILGVGMGLAHVLAKRPEVQVAFVTERAGEGGAIDWPGRGEEGGSHNRVLMD